MRRVEVTPARIARYYTDVTEAYLTYGGEARGWHYGVWEDGVRSHEEALHRSSEVLLRGITVTASTRILDVGCGAGGFAVWAAKRFGCHVTGITICKRNVVDARDYASQQQVAKNCRFVHMNMDDLHLSPASFDIVVNQESHCHSQNKERFLLAISRVLRGGGTWSSIDFTLRDGRLSASEREQLTRVLQNFHFPSLSRPREILASLKRAGFVNCETRDLTPFVLPSAAHIMRSSYLPLRIARAFPQTSLHSQDPVTEANFRGHCEAGMLYSIGLHMGLFQHVFFRATKPEREAARSASPRSRPSRS